MYGALVIGPDPEHPAQPAIAGPMARDLAFACGCMLHILEQTAVLRAVTRGLPTEVFAPPTDRQLEILRLLVRGDDDEEIVRSLCISPATLRKHRQNLYERLGVHHAHELLLVAYSAHLVSYLSESS
jgi:DNA-binding CsgD family transcriptional regulator